MSKTLSVNIEGFSDDKIRILEACIGAVRFAKEDVKFRGDVEETFCGSYPSIKVEKTNISSELYINDRNVTDPNIEW